MGYIASSETTTNTYLTVRNATGKLIKKLSSSSRVAMEMLNRQVRPSNWRSDLKVIHCIQSQDFGPGLQQ